MTNSESDSEIIHNPLPVNPERKPDNTTISIGQWYWFLCKDGHTNQDYRILGCVISLGSNYVELDFVEDYHKQRIHIQDWNSRTVYEPNYLQVISENISRSKQEVQTLLQEVNRITARLGITKQSLLNHEISDKQENNNTLAICSASEDINSYKNALIHAKEKQLPELFDRIKKANNTLANWMNAETLPLKALTEGLKESTKLVESRIFNVSIYAGISEQIIQFADGEPASYTEKLRIMQRRLYMDEECLLNYSHGGMSFKDISEFNTWLAKPENRDRIFPFPRCAVTLRVRRNKKEYECDGSFSSVFINFYLSIEDDLTFLYIRNGDKLFLVSSEQDFGAKVFPDKDLNNFTEPRMIGRDHRLESLITVREYEERVKEYNKYKELYTKWEQENPEKDAWDNPHRHNFDSLYDPEKCYSPFDSSSIYFDDINKQIAKQVEDYNRIALVIQGLFDRSHVLHPHPPILIWNPESFQNSIELIYDGSNLLYEGTPPDFEAYRNKCNETFATDSISIGQQDFFLRQEAEKENTRLDNDWRVMHYHRHKKFQPYGNPGPGQIAKVGHFQTRSRKATFYWKREKRTGYNEYINTSITVPVQELFNVSAYKLGDYKQFFQDPRTRINYLKWAPMLILAEEYHAGNIELGEV